MDLSIKSPPRWIVLSLFVQSQQWGRVELERLGRWVVGECLLAKVKMIDKRAGTHHLLTYIILPTYAHQFNINLCHFRDFLPFSLFLIFLLYFLQRLLY